MDEVLMLVKTYPSPSSKYGEITCTAGIRLSDNKLVRIYPFPFRLLKSEYRFSKYDIIVLPLERAIDDPREESYRITKLDQIKKIHHIEPKDNWSQRMRFISPHVEPSLDSFHRQMIQKVAAPSNVSLFDFDHKPNYTRVWGRSLGIIRAAAGTAMLEAKFQALDWPAKDKAKLAQIGQIEQQGLFEDWDSIASPVIPLRYCPYKFYINFQDAAGDKHRKLITDWEIIRLYFRILDETGSSDTAIQKVKYKVEQQIFGRTRDPYVIVGSIHHRYKRNNLTAIIGFIWPEKLPLLPLFEGL